MPPTPRPTAVVLDDQPGSCAAVGAVLDAAGFDVVGCADTLAVGAALLKRLSPDVAVLDLALTGLAGLGAVRDLRTVAPRCAFVVLSPFDLALPALQSGAFALIDPVDLRQLGVALHRLRARLVERVSVVQETASADSA